ncbi:MAG: 5-oxoprolinase subunit PxpA [Candidatus Limnocylindrales bacterium]
MRIDLNADVGELDDADGSVVGDDPLIALVSSVNIACGGHAGDAASMRRAVAAAHANGVAIGAHPSYPDREGFGRRDMDLSAEALASSIREQIDALATIVRDAGATMVHVKPHGALYNRAAVDSELATLIAGAVRACSPDLVLVGLAGGFLLQAGRTAGTRVAAEAFADRAYEADGTLRNRSLAGALHEDPAVAAAQAVSIVVDARVTAFDGSQVAVRADTLCLHGDTPVAPLIAAAVRQALTRAGVEIRSIG